MELLLLLLPSRLEVLPVYRHQVAVGFQEMSYFLGDRVRHPEFLQLPVALGAEVERITAPEGQ